MTLLMKGRFLSKSIPTGFKSSPQFIPGETPVNVGLAALRTAVVDSDMNVIDGPFAESKELVGGYTIVDAPDLAAACELAKKTIEMAGAATIQVREIASGGIPE